MGGFRNITTVPGHTELIDMILNKTQRKTPTQLHAGEHISKARVFYIKKVRFISDYLTDRLSLILTEFPVIEDMHPFYIDLFNILYDKDSYKMSLGFISSTKNLAQKISSESVKLIKYSETHYRCKQLKKACFGRLTSLILKLKKTLLYLEEVRQNLNRLPFINPNDKSLILAGFPNVGKSSFVNCVSRAKVDVQPYCFTTKNLFVGHFDFGLSKWQVIDTPGVLDASLDSKNLIEMQAVAAIAHVKGVVLFLIDVSTTCGFSIKKQVELCEGLEPILGEFIIVLSKVDLYFSTDNTNNPQSENSFQSIVCDENNFPISSYENANSLNVLANNSNALVSSFCKDIQNISSDLDRDLLEKRLSQIYSLKNDNESLQILTDFLLKRKFLAMSSETKENIEFVKKTSCELLLSKILSEKNTEDLNKNHHKILPILPKTFHQQEKPKLKLNYEDFADPTNISISKRTHLKRTKENPSSELYLERHKHEENQDEYFYEDKSNYICEYKHDIIPEFFYGKNIYDFISTDIFEKFKKLEEEEINKPDLRKYDILSKEERLYKEEIHSRQRKQINLNLMKNREELPSIWVKNRNIQKDDLVKSNGLNLVKEKNEKIKRNTFMKTPYRRYYDKRPQHLNVIGRGKKGSLYR